MKYRLIKSNNGLLGYGVDVLKDNKKDEKLTTFFNFIVSQFQEQIIELLDKVLKGREKEITYNFNDTCLIINNKITKIQDFLIETKDDGYKINTKELYELILKYNRMRKKEKIKKILFRKKIKKIMNLKHLKQICDELTKLIPEQKEKLEKCISENDNKLLGHIYFGDEFTNSLINLLKDYTEMEQIIKYCSFIEYMWKNGDKEVINIVDVTIIEKLSEDDDIWNKFGKNISNEFKRYINTDLIPKNVMMNDVNKL